MDDSEVINPYEIEKGELPPPPAELDTSSDTELEVEAEIHEHFGVEIPPSVDEERPINANEMVFMISKCAKEVFMISATLQGRALTWWNSQRMEHELWNLKVKDFNMSVYTQRFHELTLLCLEIVLTKCKKIDAYIQGLTDNIKGAFISSKSASLNEDMRMAHTLMEQKAQARTERIAEGNKRRWESSQGSNNSNNRNNYRDNILHHQQNNQRQGNVRATTTTQNKGAKHGGPPTCNRCGARHYGRCMIKCHKCRKIGHKERDCRGVV
nr:hypothetical protein [Tanacetum cinerariifolium]